MTIWCLFDQGGLVKGQVRPKVSVEVGTKGRRNLKSAKYKAYWASHLTVKVFEDVFNLFEDNLKRVSVYTALYPM